MLAVATNQIEGYDTLSSPSAGISPADSLPISPVAPQNKSTLPRPLDLHQSNSASATIQTHPYTGKDKENKHKQPADTLEIRNPKEEHYANSLQSPLPVHSPSAVADAFQARGYEHYEQEHGKAGRIGDGPLSPASVEFDPNLMSPSAVGVNQTHLQQHAEQRSKELAGKQQQTGASSSSSSSSSSARPVRVLEYKECADGTVSVPTEIITATHSFPAKINNKVDFYTMRTFLTSPLPPNVVFQCKMIRNRSGLKNRIYPRYELYFEATNTFLLSSKKKTSNKTSNYVISMSKKHVNNYSVEYLGKVRGNFSGSEYMLYDDGMSPKYLQNKGNVQNELYANKSKAVREELGAVFYENNILGSCPRKLHAVIPTVTIVKKAEIVKDKQTKGEKKEKEEAAKEGEEGKEGEAAGKAAAPQVKPSVMKRASWADLGNKQGSIAARYKTLQQEQAAAAANGDSASSPVNAANFDDEMMTCLQNKLPQWNKQLQAYALDFQGRAKVPSVKNFQLIQPQQPNYVMLQFGKMNKDVFSLDFKWPLSPLQAFAIALSGVDSKLVSD